MYNQQKTSISSTITIIIISLACFISLSNNSNIQILQRLKYFQVFRKAFICIGYMIYPIHDTLYMIMYDKGSSSLYPLSLYMMKDTRYIYIEYMVNYGDRYFPRRFFPRGFFPAVFPR